MSICFEKIIRAISLALDLSQISSVENSPIIEEAMTEFASNRLIKNGNFMFTPLIRSVLKEIIMKTSHVNEINYSKANGEKKPPTLEVRVADSNIPEYICAGLFILNVAIMGAIRGKKLWKYYDHLSYMEDRLNVAKRGINASIHWNKAKLRLPKYIDAFFNFYHEECQSLHCKWSLFIRDLYSYLFHISLREEH